MALRGMLYNPGKLDNREATASPTGAAREVSSSLLNVTGLQVTFLSETSGMKNVMLPWPASGNYYFDSTDELQLGKYIYIKEEQGKWFAHCSKPAFFRNSRGDICYIAELFHGGIYSLDNAGDSYTVFAEFSNERSNVFHNYRATRFVDITIGRTPDNDIQYNNPLVSRLHATLRWDKKEWIIFDQNSTNGVYVNNKRLKEASLQPGDRIFILGLRINIGIGFLSINDENGRIRIVSNLRRVTLEDANIFPEMPVQEAKEEALFNRLPRKREPLPAEPIIIEAPPISLNNDGIPLVLRMGGSMVMSTRSMFAGNITSMISSVLFPVLSSKYTEKQKREYEAKRQTKYGKYLDNIRLEIRREADFEKRVLNRNYPKLSDILQYAEDGERLWERRKEDDDFLDIRIGNGRIPLVAERKYPERRFEMDDDNLLDRMYQIAEEPVSITDAPIMTSLTEDYVSGVIGKKEIVHSFIIRMILQITVLHSYDEVKIVLLCGKEELKEMRLVRFLPHIWDDQKAFRFLAASAPEASQISEYLKSDLENDIEKPRNLKEILKDRPYFVIIAFDKKVFDSMEILKDVMRCDKNCGVSVITAFNELPKECKKVFKLSDSGKHFIVHLNQIDIPDDSFQMDDYNLEAANRCMRLMCSTKLRIVSQAYSLPKMITFLEMYGVGTVEHLNSAKRWEENNPLKSLSAPIGVSTDGTLFTLDLHEKFQGPHGLIAGMTGSGKSEFIMTYILSMAVNYSPDEVAFILIDYKGGGLAGAFEDKRNNVRLPHLMGTITNLDGASIQRSLMSIQSELINRQRIFNEVKSLLSEGTIDIYDYQKLYRNRKVKDPLPHLFIIADEFAELKTQEPDFMDKLISAARIGRSLGVHLILATQKPAGVVNDQIWGNSKFKACLRVQDRSDSFDMLKRPEAAELKNPGRFYLQVGYNEFFALGQSAWCGAEYIPKSSVYNPQKKEFELIDNVGQTIANYKSESHTIESKSTQIVEIIKYISSIAKEKGVVRGNLWKEPLKDCIDISFIEDNYAVETIGNVDITVGLADDPMNQRQFPYIIDLQHVMNLLVVGASGSGKTTLLQTVLYELSTKYPPERVNFYIFDFSSHNLAVFGKVPHCGAVLLDEKEKEIELLMSFLKEKLQERRRKFSIHNAGSFEAYLSIETIPLIVVVIDNIAGFSEFKNGNDFYDSISEIMRNGNSYGIKVIATANSANDCPYRMQRDFGEVIALQLKDRYAYINTLNCRCDFELPDIKGRGIFVHEGRCVEYQTALFVKDKNEINRIQILLKCIEEIIDKYKKSKPAEMIDVVDENETYSNFCQRFRINRIPLGYCEDNLKKVAIPFQQFNQGSIYIGTPEVKAIILQNWLEAAHRNNMKLVIVKNHSSNAFEDIIPSIFESESRDVKSFTCNNEGLHKLADYLNSIIVERTSIRKECCEKEDIVDWKNPENIKKWRVYLRERTEPIMVVIESFMKFQLSLDTDLCGTFETFFDFGIGYNIYYMGLSYPDDEMVLENEKGMLNIEDNKTKADDRKNEIRQIIEHMSIVFNKDKFALLFGGRFDKQKIIHLPYEYSSITTPCEPNNYNKFLMHYQGKLVRMIMPCGDLNSYSLRVSDEDEELIV